MATCILPRALRIPITARHRSFSLALVAVLLVLVFHASSFLAESLGFKLVPVSFNMLQSEMRLVGVSTRHVDWGYVLNRWVRGWFLRYEVGMFEDIFGTRPLSGIIAEDGRDKVHGARCQHITVNILENALLAFGWPHEVEPWHLHEIWPFGLRGSTQKIVELVHLAQFATFAGEHSLLGEHLHADTRSTPHIHGWAVSGLTKK
jgi:hypothetical protein